MAEQIRVGVIGTSRHAERMHLLLLKSHTQAKIAAICGRSRERAEEMAQKLDIPQVFTDYRAMIEKGRLQAVIVAVPDDLHYPMTMDALDAGLHVLCEKPLALNADQARQMLEKAEAADVKHMTYFTWRWVPHLRYARQLIEEGYIGACYHCHFQWLAGYGREAQYGWKWDRRRALGILGDLGSHMIDLARWCVGEVDRVNAHLATFVERPGAEDQSLDAANDSALLAVQFHNGAHGAIHVSAVAHAADPVQHLALHGEAGTLEVDRKVGMRYTIRGARDDEKEIKTLAVPEHLLEGVDLDSPVGVQLRQMFETQSIGTRLFVDAIIEDRPISPSFYDGLKAQEVIDAAMESDRQGCWVSVT